MRFLAFGAAMALGLVGTAVAEESSDLTGLMTAYEARGWEGVGRLNIGAGGMCTGALVAPRLVLTAAHCIYDDSTKQPVDPGEIQFLAGWRNGTAQAFRGVRRAMAHPDYEYIGPTGDLRVSSDIALLELESEIRLANVQPFETASRPRKGAEVGVVSYAQGREDSASLQEVCHVLARQKGSLILSCDVDFGASGAPIFTFEDGRARIVSVVSAKAMVRDQHVALGTNLEKPLADLMALMGASDGVFSRREAVPTANAEPAFKPVVRRGLASGQGAKFVKP